jgi:hypothetical protein
MLEMHPEEAERISTELKEITSWLEGFEAGRGSPTSLSIESIRQFSQRIKNRSCLRLVENEQF